MRSKAESQDAEAVLRATFIVRLVRDPGNSKRDGGWHGTVEHVQSGERRGVATTAGMPALLLAWLETLEA